ncbi:MAG: HD domain-containing protein [Bacteroidetes bacterium]|nr:HD domain-containing protein [Bacteroidota bacterium]
MNRHKIINDPVYGFIQIPSGILYDIIQHPIFQRLRRIRQLGFTNLVYPGAEHTRFQHAIGAFHLMTNAIEVLKQKGVKITDAETEAAQLAILLHDIGHGPYSHSLEGSLLPFHHETITKAILDHLNVAFNGKLELAIKIFNGVYKKHFLHELVSSQLDVDRLDYLNRDRFFTGVYEGVIGYDRILHMLNVHDGHLVVEEKGIYSIEKFLVARRLMYWQVYLHKTSLGAESMLILLIKRIRKLQGKSDVELNITNSLQKILASKANRQEELKEELLLTFTDIDDADIMAAIKSWRDHPDKIVSYLSKSIYARNLFKTILGSKEEIDKAYNKIKNELEAHSEWTANEINELVIKGKAENNAYKTSLKNISILFKDGRVKDISKASNDLDIRTLSKTITKHYVTYPRIKLH